MSKKSKSRNANEGKKVQVQDIPVEEGLLLDSISTPTSITDDIQIYHDDDDEVKGDDLYTKDGTIDADKTKQATNKLTKASNPKSILRKSLYDGSKNDRKNASVDHQQQQQQQPQQEEEEKKEEEQQQHDVSSIRPSNNGTNQHRSNQEIQEIIELQTMIAEMYHKLQQFDTQYDNEKENRKKKEHSLFKLAKELKKRNIEEQINMKQLNKLEEEKKELEQDWILIQQDLEEERQFKVQQQKQLKATYHQILSEEQTNYNNLLQRQEMTIEEMKRNHQRNCHELCEAILNATNNTNRLDRDLQYSMLSPQKGRRHNSYQKQKYLFKSRTQKSIITIIVMILGIFCFREKFANLFTIETVCSPLMPGRILVSSTDQHMNRVSSIRFEAPWWAPRPFKPYTFSKLCASSSMSKDFQAEVDIPNLEVEWSGQGRVVEEPSSSNGMTMKLTLPERKHFKRNNVKKIVFCRKEFRIWTSKGESYSIEAIPYVIRDF